MEPISISESIVEMEVEKKEGSDSVKSENPEAESIVEMEVEKKDGSDSVKSEKPEVVITLPKVTKCLILGEFDYSFSILYQFV